jgi:ribosomal protein S2
MGDLVNLRTFRKRQGLSKAEVKAAQNRVDFGLTKPEKSKAKSEREKSARLLSGLRLGGKPDGAA